MYPEVFPARNGRTSFSGDVGETSWEDCPATTGGTAEDLMADGPGVGGLRIGVAALEPDVLVLGRRVLA